MTSSHLITSSSPSIPPSAAPPNTAISNDPGADSEWADLDSDQDYALPTPISLSSDEDSSIVVLNPTGATITDIPVVTVTPSQQLLQCTESLPILDAVIPCKCRCAGTVADCNNCLCAKDRRAGRGSGCSKDCDAPNCSDKLRIEAEEKVKNSTTTTELRINTRTDSMGRLTDIPDNISVNSLNTETELQQEINRIDIITEEVEQKIAIDTVINQVTNNTENKTDLVENNNNNNNIIQNTIAIASISSSEIHMLLNTSGYNLIENKGQGNCLVLAISQGINNGDDSKHQEIRTTAMAYMSNPDNFEKFTPVFIEDQFNGKGKLPRYIVRVMLSSYSDIMKLIGEPLDSDLSAEAIALTQNIRLKIYTLRRDPVSGEWYIECTFDHNPLITNKERIINIFHHNDHYRLMKEIIPINEPEVNTVEPIPEIPSSPLLVSRLEKKVEELELKVIGLENDNKQFHVLQKAHDLLAKKLLEVENQLKKLTKQPKKSTVDLTQSIPNRTSGTVNPERRQQVPTDGIRVPPVVVTNVPKPPTFASVVGGNGNAGIVNPDVPISTGISPAPIGKNPSTSNQLVLVSKNPFPSSYDNSINGLNAIRSILIDSTIVSRDNINKVKIIRRNEFVTILQFATSEIANQVLLNRKLLTDYTKQGYYIRQDLSYQQRKQIAEKAISNGHGNKTIYNRFTQQQHDEFNRQNGFQQVPYNRHNPNNFGYPPRR